MEREDVSSARDSEGRRMGLGEQVDFPQNWQDGLRPLGRWMVSQVPFGPGLDSLQGHSPC